MVPLSLEDTVLHHKARMTPISPPSQRPHGEVGVSADSDMPLYSMCFDGRNPKRFKSTEIALQLRVSEKKYSQGFIAHGQLPAFDQDNEFDPSMSARSKTPSRNIKNNVWLYLPFCFPFHLFHFVFRFIFHFATYLQP